MKNSSKRKRHYSHQCGRQFVNHFNGSGTSGSVNFLRSIHCVSPVSGNIYFVDCVNTGINCLVVHFNNVVALLAV